MREKKETLDKENKKRKFKKVCKKQKLREQGITLIALVVTIIILLILAGVTLNIALSDNGLFGKAKKATEEYKQAQSKEEDLISQFATQMYSEYVGAYVTFGDSIQIGKTDGSVEMTTDDEVIKEFEEREKDEVKSMKWRIWDYDGDTVRLISEKPTRENLVLR